MPYCVWYENIKVHFDDRRRWPYVIVYKAVTKIEATELAKEFFEENKPKEDPQGTTYSMYNVRRITPTERQNRGMMEVITLDDDI